MHRTQGSFEGKRHQGEVSCSLDRCRKLPLMASTVARDAARNNLAPLCDQVPQAPHVFVIDQGQFVCAEPTDLLAQKAPAFARRRFLFRGHHGHRPTLLLRAKPYQAGPQLLERNIVVLERRGEIHLLRST